jgi:hypothetical protein
MKKASKSIECLKSSGFNELYNIKGGRAGLTISGNSKSVIAGDDSDDCECDDKDESQAHGGLITNGNQ